jgi:hypothetical protein
MCIHHVPVNLKPLESLDLVSISYLCNLFNERMFHVERV